MFKDMNYDLHRIWTVTNYLSKQRVSFECRYFDVNNITCWIEGRRWTWAVDINAKRSTQTYH